MCVSFLFLPLGVFAEYVVVDPQQIEGMIVLGHLSAYDSTTISGLDIKGDYLYCSSPWGVHAVNISDPTNMQFSILNEVFLDLKGQGVGHYGDTLYVANWSSSRALRVLDITEPGLPTLIRTITTAADQATWTLEIYDGLLLLELNNKAQGVARINIYDVATDPTNPNLLGYAAGLTEGGGINNASKYQDYMYFTNNQWLYVYDISTPSTPQYVRRISFNADPVDSHIGHDNNLYVLARDSASYGTEHGFYSFSLTDPSNPQQLDYVDIDVGTSKHFHLHDVTDTAYVVGGGSSIFTLDISDPDNMSTIRHWSVSWPDPYHPGWSARVTGAGRYIYVGTTQGTGNPTDCDAFDDNCEWYGARIYAIRVATMPPVIAEVTPDPDKAYVNHEYTKQLTLVQGDPLIIWSVSQAPAGTTVDSNGLVGDWVPSVGDLGQLVTLEIKAMGYMYNEDYESWTVYVKYLSDFDNDFDVDQEDFGFFQGCYSGAGNPYPQGCEEADLNDDNSVDQADFDIFHGCLGGANNMPGC
jgi:hypothetical protein